MTDQPVQGRPSRRTMLTHMGQTVRGVHSAEIRSSEAGIGQPTIAASKTSGPQLAHPGRKAKPVPSPPVDPLLLLLGAACVAGLTFIVLAAWIIFTPQSADSQGAGGYLFQRLELGSGGSREATRTYLASAEATRDAQQIEIANLRDERGKMQGDLASLKATATVIAKREGATHLDRPPLALILDVPVYKQEHSLSCEASSAAMAASFHGLGIKEQDVLDALPRHEDPSRGFRGNVDGTYGGIDDYGVYAEPLRQVLVGLGLRVEHLKGGADQIRGHIRQGKPVMVWITYGLQAQVPRQTVLSDGRVISLVPYEHSVLVVGYNRQGLWVNDPYAGTQDFYPEAEFARSFAYLNNMGLVIGPPGD